MFTLRTPWVCACIVSLTVTAAWDDVLAGDFVITLQVVNLKGMPLVEGIADDEPGKVLTGADLILTGTVYVGKVSVDREINAAAVAIQPAADPRDNRKRSVYTIRLSAPDVSQVARLVVRLPGRQQVDLRRIAAVTQVITVSMPEETKTTVQCRKPCCCGTRRARRCRR